MSPETDARSEASSPNGRLLDTMFDLPGMTDVQEVVVNEEAVDAAEAKPLLIYAEKKEPKTAG